MSGCPENFSVQNFYGHIFLGAKVFGRENYCRESLKTRISCGRKIKTGIFGEQKPGSGKFPDNKRFGDYQQSAPQYGEKCIFLVCRKAFSGVLVAPLLRHQSPEGEGALLAMAPEQVIQHYRKGGCPSGGGGAPESGFLMLLNLLTSID
ncbi:MAG: hypothetical protein ABSG28_06840 [Methanoregula sp.]|jgi:hypothetical protein|uniref:hypothetical protein n=1 Tax=Methanoregula sp. TaxID=2052170 RepID=UPI003C165E8A